MKICIKRLYTKSFYEKKGARLYAAMILMAARFAWQPICNATKALHELLSEQFHIIHDQRIQFPFGMLAIEFYCPFDTYGVLL